MMQLEKQLNTILSFLLPDDIEIKAIKADVTYLKLALIRAKGGTMTIMKEKTFVSEIFTVLNYRKNKIAYTFQTKLNAHKTDGVK